MPSFFCRSSVFCAVDVPALVELAAVLVGPLLEHVVRRVGGTGGVIHHPRLLGVLRAHGVQPLDGLVGEVVGEVVGLAVLALRHADNGVVLGDDRVVLARSAGQKPPIVVESPSQRPVVERPGRSLHVVRGQMPLAETACDITVVAQYARQRGATARLDRRISRERARDTRRSIRSPPGDGCARSAAPRGSASTPR